MIWQISQKDILWVWEGCPNLTMDIMNLEKSLSETSPKTRGYFLALEAWCPKPSFCYTVQTAGWGCHMDATLTVSQQQGIMGIMKLPAKTLFIKRTLAESWVQSFLAQHASSWPSHFSWLRYVNGLYFLRLCVLAMLFREIDGWKIQIKMSYPVNIT